MSCKGKNTEQKTNKNHDKNQLMTYDFLSGILTKKICSGNDS